MPLIKISLKKGKSKEFCSTFMEIVARSVIDRLGLAPEDRNQLLTEYEPDFFQAKPPYEYFIEIFLFTGRTMDTKVKLYRDLVTKLSEGLQIDPQSVYIVINEQPLENWGLRGGICPAEIRFDHAAEL